MESVDVASQVPASSYQAMARPKLRSGDRLVNTGVWLLRSERAKAFLDLIWDQESRIDHGWWEQMAALDLLGFDEEGGVAGPSEWLDRTSWLSDEWNSLEWMDGLLTCRSRHYSARSNEYRAARMAVDLAAMNGERTAWFKDLVWRRSQPEYRRRRWRNWAPVQFVRKVRNKIRYEIRKLHHRMA